MLVKDAQFLKGGKGKFKGTQTTLIKLQYSPYVEQLATTSNPEMGERGPIPKRMQNLSSIITETR